MAGRWHTAREQALPVTIARFFNTVGPRQTGRYGMVLPTFVRQALRGETLTIHGTGEQRRCFSYIGDVAEALMRLAQTPEADRRNYQHRQRSGESASTNWPRWSSRLPDRRRAVEHMSYAQAYGDGIRRHARGAVPCLEKLERLVHYRPTTPLDTIVRRVVDYEWVRRTLERSKAVALAV